VYKDEGIPALEAWFGQAHRQPGLARAVRA